MNQTYEAENEHILSATDLSLQNLCKELHQKIDVADEERYDVNAKVVKNNMEVGRKSQLHPSTRNLFKCITAY